MGHFCDVHIKQTSVCIEELTLTRWQTNQNIRIDNTLSLARANFFYQSSKLWNNVPLHIRKTKNLASFKSQIKIWIKNRIQGVPK